MFKHVKIPQICIEDNLVGMTTARSDGCPDCWSMQGTSIESESPEGFYHSLHPLRKQDQGTPL